MADPCPVDPHGRPCGGGNHYCCDLDNVHHIERPEDYLSAGELALLAEEAAPHCATCRCGEG